MDKRLAMRLEWSNRAKKDMQGIVDYYTPIAGAKVARKIVQKIYARAQILINNPLAGQHEKSLDNLPVEYRRLVDGNYKIVYFVDEPTVIISSIFDCRREPSRLRAGVAEAIN